MQDRDLATMSLNDWMELADWEWEHVGEQITAEMYLAQAKKRACTEEKNRLSVAYEQAKLLYDAACARQRDAAAEFADLRDTGKMVQSLLRAKKS